MEGMQHNWTEQGIVIMMRRQVAELSAQKDDMNRQFRGRIPAGDERWRHMVIELEVLAKTLRAMEAGGRV